MKRRGFLTAAAAAMTGGAATAQPRGARLQVWRDPSCGCCGGWVEHMWAAGFRAEVTLVQSLAAPRRNLGIPADLLSCHAAAVEGYSLEGHVPAAAVQRLLSERPAGIRGLAVPGMPLGSPGMEVPGQPDEIYDVIAFGSGGPPRPFMRFRGSQAV